MADDTTFSSMSEEELKKASEVFESITNNPHDHFFRDSFTERKVALAAIREYLPAQLEDWVEPGKYSLVREYFMDEKLREKISDVLISIPLKENKTAYLYFLFEHQRAPRPLMAYRLQQLEHGIFDFHLRTRKTGKLPLIIKVVFYNGKKAWQEPEDFFGLFEVPADLARQIMTAPYQLTDLSRMSDENLKKTTHWNLVKQVMKHIDDEDVIDFIRELIPKLEKVSVGHTGIRFFEAIVNYLFLACQARTIPQQLYDTIELVRRPELKERVMTIADWLRAEGKKVGHQEGVQQGAQKTKTQTAIRLLERGFDISFIQNITDLSFEEITSLKTQVP